MSIVIFFLLALAVIAAIAYPLLPGRAATEEATAFDDAEIAQAVDELRRRRRRGGLFCPACGAPYQPGDRFCVRCGGELPAPQQEALLCPQCGTPYHEGDRFCVKCGHALAEGTA